MIPKKIHYCWFGGNPKSDIIEMCMASWKKQCLGWKIVEWNETNLNINMGMGFGASKHHCSDKEMLGENNEWGIVTENDEEALHQGIKTLLDNLALLAHYKQQAMIRSKDFSTENTVRAVEGMLVEVRS